MGVTPVNILLLIVTLAANVISTCIIRNKFCKDDMKNNADLQLFNAVSSMFAAIVLLIIAVVTDELVLPSLYTLFLGAVFGLATALCAVFTMKALETGPISYTSVIISCSLIIPAMSGAVLYGEKISLWQYIGTAFMLISFVCAVDKKNDGVAASPRWLVLCMASFVFCGSVGVMQKIHQSSAHRAELSVFLITAFIVSAVFSFILVAYCGAVKKQKPTVLKKTSVKRFLLFGTGTGLGIALCNQINLYLSGRMAAIIFFPVVNGAYMILATLAGVLLWRERLSVKQWTGLIIGMVSIILLCGVLG